ncbi:MAG TPA: hypothetical protein VM577_08540 [Anaerovoracaceae bacterium]|nr:hypothetical protein [Anaerovoracaceae bacterium]
MSFDFFIQQGDIVIGEDGDIQKVENTTKLEQDILKMVITPLGSNIFHTWYGSAITKSLVGTSFDMQMTSTIASGQLRTALETLQKLQKLQASAQIISPSEQIAAIQKVQIERNAVDPRFFTIIIKVVAKDLSSVQTRFNVKPSL